MRTALTDDERSDLRLCLRPHPTPAAKTLHKTPIAGRFDAETKFSHAGFGKEAVNLGDEVRAHEGTIHALACDASRTEQRAHAGACGAVRLRMSENAWKQRLEAAIKENWLDKGHSMAALSRKIGRGQNYVSQMLSDGKSPRVDDVIAIAKLLGVSASWIVVGAEIGREDESLLMLASRLEPDRKQMLLDLLNSLAAGNGSRS